MTSMSCANSSLRCRSGSISPSGCSRVRTNASARCRAARATGSALMPPEGVAFLFTISIVGGVVLLFPVVRALAERIRGRADGGVREEIQMLREDLLAEIQQTRREIGDLGERIDFTERLLAKKSQT